MEPFVSHTGRAVPLRRGNVDTDQIIPAEYLKRVSRSGFADGLFAAWRADPDFILNRPAAQGATILVAGPDFGIGSSREHAVWALMDFGFRAVISSRFGDIFRLNAVQSGLLPVRVDQTAVTALQDALAADPDLPVTVDLRDLQVRAGLPGGSPMLTASFDIDEHSRWRLMEGLDDISLTLRREQEIAAFERTRRPDWLPSIR
jgi:3-isopropylmalate/(R)-2-methylmalate dehydratase small subunit